MSRDVTHTVIGVVAFAALALGFVVWMPSEPLGPNLSVEVPTVSGHVVIDHPMASLPELTPQPDSIEPRLDVESWAAREGTRLQLSTYRATWGKRWIEEVTVPILAGPFRSETASVCGYRVGVSSKVLDTTGPARAVEQLLTSRLRAMSLFVSRTIRLYGVEKRFSFQFPPVADVDLDLPFAEGHVEPRVRVVLADGSFIAGSAKLTLESQAGKPQLRTLSPARSSHGGAAFESLKAAVAEFGADFGEDARWNIPPSQVAKEQGTLKALGYTACRDYGKDSWLFGSFCEREVRNPARAEGRKRALEMIAKALPGEVASRVNEQYVEAVSTMNAGLEGLTKPWQPFGEDGGITVAFRLGEQPVIDPSGIRVSLCMQWLGMGVSPADDVPGPLEIHGRTSGFELPRGRPIVRVRASSGALNHLLWGLWRSGKLREVGTVSALLALFDDEQRGRVNELLQNLAFEVTGVDARLPPVVEERGRLMGQPRLVVTLADAVLGRLAGREVVGHVEGTVSVTQVGDDVMLGLLVQQIAANCRERSSSGSRVLMPCLSDLLPPLRTQLIDVERTVTLRGSDMLMRIPVIELKGVKAKMANLRVGMVSPGPALDIQVDTSFEPSAAIEPSP